MGNNLRIFRDVHALYSSAAVDIEAIILAALKSASRFSLVLSGGETPRGLYEALSRTSKIDWSKVHLFWGDERMVSPTDKSSNYNMARETLIEKIDIPEENIHRIKGELGAEEASKNYEEVLKTYFGEPWPTFDLVLLGLGTDGHTASLFPDSPGLKVSDRSVTPNPGPIAERVTLTFSALERARRIMFLAAGLEKREILAKVLDPAAEYPASLVNRNSDDVRWYVDRDAAGKS